LSLSCKLCAKPIKFDNKHISQRTGKKIPLDIKTNEPHDCPARRDQQQQQGQPQQRRYHQCNKGCGQEIYFEDCHINVNSRSKVIEMMTRVLSETEIASRLQISQSTSRGLDYIRQQ
jgi:hypothetical protein